MAVEYLGLSEINGPLVVLEGVQGAAYDEIVEMTVDGKEKKLGRIPADHVLFTHGPYKFADSGFTAEAAARYPGETFPLLYGVSDGDRLALVYSPVDLAGGWQQVPRPGSVMYLSSAAGRLGGTIVTYFLTH